MRGRKITEKEFNHAPKINLKKTSVIKVFKGNVIIDDPYLKIPAGTYAWFVLVPEEFIGTLEWNKIFRTAYARRMLRTEKTNWSTVKYKSISLENGSLLFAFP